MICRKYFLLHEELRKKQEGFSDYANALEALRGHFRNCPNCLAWFRSFPADGPAYPVHEHEEDDRDEPDAEAIPESDEFIYP